jgi:hypothetical protein
MRFTQADLHYISFCIRQDMEAMLDEGTEGSPDYTAAETLLAKIVTLEGTLYE